MPQSSRKQTSDYQNKVIRELEAIPNKHRFTEFEDSVIKRFYATKGSIPISEKLGKTPEQVRHRAQLLGAQKHK